MRKIVIGLAIATVAATAACGNTAASTANRGSPLRPPANHASPLGPPVINAKLTVDGQNIQSRWRDMPFRHGAFRICLVVE